MTNEECVKILRQVKDGDLLTFDKSRRKALDMAIEIMGNIPTQMSGTSGSDTNVGGKDAVYRQDSIEAVKHAWAKGLEPSQYIESLTSAQLEPCEYYALCRHGRDENKLRARLGVCEYCNRDADGFVTPVEKNGHAFVRFGMNGWELSMKANGWHGSAKIRYCPMCGRDLLVK